MATGKLIRLDGQPLAHDAAQPVGGEHPVVAAQDDMGGRSRPGIERPRFVSGRLGLRSLAPHHPDYKPTYRGDLLARDAAYHQGTVWSWLIGPYIDAAMRVRPEDARGAMTKLEGLVAHLSDACIGNISEVFDAGTPYTPGGCIAQAWGVAELLRCLVRLTQKHS